MDLIDRQALIKQLKDENIPFNADINEIINIQPVAFDVEKVVAELEKEKEKYYKEFEKATDTLSGICYGNMSNVYGHTISIVKAGGVNG